jgi:hypothetical protein
VHDVRLAYVCCVDCGLLIAAGGGGDAIAAAILHRALDGSTRPAIATYSWDRLLIDPLPGPRDPSDFSDLELVGEHNYRVTARTRVREPAGSTLPGLAAELEADLYLLDPRHGAQGIARQLDELTRKLHTDTVTIVDVGGDILAHGDEPTLRSPLADSLALAAINALDREADVLVTGAGVDGELPAALVLERCTQLAARTVHALTASDVEPFAPLFEWHPSEATGLLCAAAAGVRGVAEIRDRGLPVTLTDDTPIVYALDSPSTVHANRLARQLARTSSLAQAEDVVRAIGRESEIDYERRKARSLAEAAVPDPPAEASLSDRLAEIRADAAHRRVDFITLRGLAERLGLPGSRLADLRYELRSRPTDEYLAPLWIVRPASGREPAAFADSPAATDAGVRGR